MFVISNTILGSLLPLAGITPGNVVPLKYAYSLNMLNGTVTITDLPAGSQRTTTTLGGTILTTLTLRALYTHDGDLTTTPAFADENWLAYTIVPEGTNTVTQVVFNGKPLYTYVPDAADGVASGDGLGLGVVWHKIVLG